jgi:alpha-L-fucosidase
MDPHHLYGSQTRYASNRIFMPTFPCDLKEDLPPYTTSVYQTFMTTQITELIERYGPIGIMWIDLPGELGTGYRTFIYNYMAQMQPDSIIIMNTGVPDSTKYDYHYAFPSDLIAIERGLPPKSGYQKWRTIEGKEYYIPGEVCDPIGQQWYHLPPDPPRPDETLLGILQACMQRGANLLLDVPPSKKGVIPDDYVQALMRLRKNANL